MMISLGICITTEKKTYIFYPLNILLMPIILLFGLGSPVYQVIE